MIAPSAASRSKSLLMILLALAVLLPSLYGFGSKFIEFVALYRGDVEGVFAITPIVNYLLASLGFLFLFGWAVWHGMFRDIERPKHTMLENERWLDRLEATTESQTDAPAWTSVARSRDEVLDPYAIRKRHGRS
ncbi:MAG: hypothetical protein AB7U73_05780 [Pirellulales bacterium]